MLNQLNYRLGQFSEIATVGNQLLATVVPYNGVAFLMWNFHQTCTVCPYHYYQINILNERTI